MKKQIKKKSILISLLCLTLGIQLTGCTPFNSHESNHSSKDLWKITLKDGKHEDCDKVDHFERSPASKDEIQKLEQTFLKQAKTSQQKGISRERTIASVHYLSHMLPQNLSKSKDATQEDICEDLTAQELEDMVEIIYRLGGDVVDPYDYPATVSGLDQFLKDSGVISRFSAHEMVRPNNPPVAQRCGKNKLLPPQCRWTSGAVQGLVASRLRAVINDGDPHGPTPISLRNWWRPQCYNSGVGGARASDHIQARGFDLDFRTPQQRALAQNYLCHLYQKSPFNLQVGIGCQTLHVGVGSPKRIPNYPDDGSRFWTYGSIGNCPIKRLSTDNCWKIDRSGMRFIHDAEVHKTSGTPRPIF